MSKAAQIDSSILRFTRERWQKVAVVAAKVIFQTDPDMSDVSDRDVAERVRVLADEGRIELQGDLCNLRKSLVRLPE